MGTMHLKELPGGHRSKSRQVPRKLGPATLIAGLWVLLLSSLFIAASTVYLLVPPTPSKDAVPLAIGPFLSVSPRKTP